MSHVFISYEQADSDYALDLAIKLEEAGINAWIDTLKIEPGENWDEERVHAIQTASHVIIIYSYAMTFDGNSLDIIDYARREKIKAMPIGIRLDEIDLTRFSQAFPIFDADDSELISKISELLPNYVKNDSLISVPRKPKTKGYIFISYSIEDLAFVEKLRKFFGDKGYAYWDYQESHRKYEMPFHLEIEEAIKGAKAIASVVSPDWKRSKWATREFLFSEQINKTNFVLIARQVGATLLYADKTFIEFFNDEEKGFELLDKALRREGLVD